MHVARAVAPRWPTTSGSIVQCTRRRPESAVDLLPGADVIEELVDAAFCASVHVKKATSRRSPSRSFRPSRRDPADSSSVLPARCDSAHAAGGPAVERPGIHLGVWPAYERPGLGRLPTRPWLRSADPGALQVWGTTHAIPPFCFVVEVIAPGLLVLKHRPMASVAEVHQRRRARRRFASEIVDEGTASRIADCPTLLTSMIGFDTQVTRMEALGRSCNWRCRCASNGRGGILLVVPPTARAGADSIIQSDLVFDPAVLCRAGRLISAGRGDRPDHEWLESVNRAVDLVAASPRLMERPS
jgi:hypothetical protein